MYGPAECNIKTNIGRENVEQRLSTAGNLFEAHFQHPVFTTTIIIATIHSHNSEHSQIIMKRKIKKRKKVKKEEIKIEKKKNCMKN